MKTLILFIGIFIICLPISAQDNLPRAAKERINARKVAFITQKLNLSVEEAQMFWPVYNEYDGKKEELQKSRRQLIKRIILEGKSVPEAELEKLSDEYIDIDMKESQLAKEYYEKFKQVLPVKKVLKLYYTENQFKRQLLREIKERQEFRRHN